MRLLLIEDDDILGEGLRDFLSADGHSVRVTQEIPLEDGADRLFERSDDPAT